MSITRRSFLATAAAAAVATEIDAATGMPMRTLGRTGEKVSVIAFGGGSRFLEYGDPEKGAEALERALKAGVNYVDTAAGYGNGKSEQWIGEFLKTHRKNFFLATKVGPPRTYDESMRTIERSLKYLGLDQVDLLHVHSLQGEDDLAAIEAPNGQLKAVQKAKEQKMARFIGITCHADPAVLKMALERHDFDSTQMALNIAQIGGGRPSLRVGDPATGPKGFEAIAMPVALRKKMGLTGMKVWAQDRLKGKATPEMMLRYVLTLPIAATSCGLPKLEYIDTAVNVAKNFKPLSREEMRRLPGTIPADTRAALNEYFAAHMDC